MDRLDRSQKYLTSRRVLSTSSRSSYVRSSAFPFRSRSTRTSSASLFCPVDARVLVASVRRTLCYSPLFLPSFDFAGRRRRAPSSVLASLSPSLRLLVSCPLFLSLSRYYLISASSFLVFYRSPFLSFSPDLTQIPRITQTRVFEGIGHNNGRT